MNELQKSSDNLEATVESVDRSGIASIRKIVSGIINIIDDPKATVKDLQDIIEVDPPLTGKVLRVANSVYYGPMQQISGIEKAVIRIGFNALKQIALCQKICEIFNDSSNYRGFSRILLWKHSVAVALLGKMIFRMEFRKCGEDIYTAGLLHEIGIIAEDQLLHDDFKKILEISFTEKKDLAEAENHVLGYHHAALGMALLDHWDLPPELGKAVGYHHNPNDAPSEYSQIVMTLYIADCLCLDRGIGYTDSPYHDRNIYEKCLERLNIEQFSLDMIVERMEDEISKM